MRSLISVLPVVAMDSDDMTWIGLVLTAFGAAMREPVTTISCRGSAVTASLGCCCATAGRLIAAAMAPTKRRFFQAEKRWMLDFSTSNLKIHMLRVSLKRDGRCLTRGALSLRDRNHPIRRCLAQSVVIRK